MAEKKTKPVPATAASIATSRVHLDGAALTAWFREHSPGGFQRWAFDLLVAMFPDMTLGDARLLLDGKLTLGSPVVDVHRRHDSDQG